MGATVKRNNTAVVARYAKQQRIQSVKDSAYLTFHWYCKNKKKDKDNISFAKKFILDGLVQAGVLPNDGWNDIEGFKDEFYIDKQDPRIEVEIT
jgi:hypothetical protein